MRKLEMAFPTLFYYINTSEIPSELSRENFISSRDHCRYGYVINHPFESKPILYFTGVYIINRIVKYKRHVLVVSSCSMFNSISHSFAALTREISS